MLLQVTKALMAMVAEAMVIVRATVEITVAAAVEAKKVTTLAVARASHTADQAFTGLRLLARSVHPMRARNH